MTDDTTETSASAWQERVRALKNIPPVLKIVWKSGPHVVLLGLVFRVLASLVPVSLGWVTGAIVGEVARILAILYGSPNAYLDRIVAAAREIVR